MKIKRLLKEAGKNENDIDYALRSNAMKFFQVYFPFQKQALASIL